MTQERCPPSPLEVRRLASSCLEPTQMLRRPGGTGAVAAQQAKWETKWPLLSSQLPRPVKRGLPRPSVKPTSSPPSTV